MAMKRAMGAAGAWNIDMSRVSRETLPPDVYLVELLLPEMGARARAAAARRAASSAPTRSPPAMRCARQAAQARQVHADERRARAGARLVRPRRRRRRRASSRATACGRRTSTRPRIRACRAMCAAMSAWSSAPRLPRLSGLRPRSASGENPQWLYTVRVRRPRTVGRRCRPDRHGLDRRVRALSGAGLTGRSTSPPRRARPPRCRAFRATTTARSSASRGRRRPSPWRWRCTSAALFTWTRMGGDARRRDQARAGRRRSRHRRDLLPPLAGDARAAGRREGRHRRATLARYRDAWDHAADRTPHGPPIELTPAISCR